MADTDQLILVDENDQAVGEIAKWDAHVGEGKLHRAFSIFLVNGRAEVLLQKRSAQKPLWPLFWSNTCCSHPRVGESLEIAVQRRLKEELSLSAPLHHLFSFQYQARYNSELSENELCHVYVGRCDDIPQVDPDEIAEVRYVAIDRLHEALNAEEYTPWFRSEWATIRQSHWHTIKALVE